MQKVKKDSDDGTGEEDYCKDKEIVLHTLIDTEKHEESDTGIGDESREHGTRRNDTVKEKLSDYDGRSTIWNKSDQGGYERRENACVCRKIRNSVFTDPMDAETDDKREEKDKECNLYRMENCGEKNPLMTMAIFILADSRDLFFAIGSFFKVQNKVYGKTDDNTAQNLDPEDREDSHGRNFFGDHNGKHFIRCRDENCDQGADGDNSSRIEIRGGSGKAALRN